MTLIIMAVVVALAAVLLLWWLWWGLPKRQVNRFRISDPKMRADIEDNLRKTVSQLLTGAMVLVGAGVAATVAYQQLLSQQQASRDLLISNQVGKGFELLGNKDSQIQRIGGIYVLEGVMNTSNEYYQPVLEALCAFVRNSTRTTTEMGPPAVDIQATLTVIGRRKRIAGTPDLSKAHIPNADLHGVNLTGADLSEAELSAANLTHANLTGAILWGAKLGGASLHGANLTGANVAGANLHSATPTDANLTGANLTGDTLTFANLTGADLSGTMLAFARLSDAVLSGTNLERANLTGANLRGAKSLTQTQLDQACGTDAMLDPGLTLRERLNKGLARADEGQGDFLTGDGRG